MAPCSVVKCKNSSAKGFFMKRFPKDPQRRNLWAARVNRKDWTPNDNSYLCEMHFELDQWEKTRTDGTRKLKANAIPTIFENVPQTKPLIPHLPEQLHTTSVIENKAFECTDMCIIPNTVFVCTNAPALESRILVNQGNSATENGKNRVFGCVDTAVGCINTPGMASRVFPYTDTSAKAKRVFGCPDTFSMENSTYECTSKSQMKNDVTSCIPVEVVMNVEQVDTESANAASVQDSSQFPPIVIVGQPWSNAPVAVVPEEPLSKDKIIQNLQQELELLKEKYKKLDKYATRITRQNCRMRETLRKISYTKYKEKVKEKKKLIEKQIMKMEYCD